MRQFEIKKNGHEWQATHCDTGISAVIPSVETQPKAVLLAMADDYLYWFECQERKIEVSDHQMIATKNFMLDIEFTKEDAERLQWELATEACADPETFYGGE